jgi:hypothetical protein
MLTVFMQMHLQRLQLCIAISVENLILHCQVANIKVPGRKELLALRCQRHGKGCGPSLIFLSQLPDSSYQGGNGQEAQMTRTSLVRTSLDALIALLSHQGLLPSSRRMVRKLNKKVYAAGSVAGY